MPGRTASPSSASAWACSARSSSSPATWLGLEKANSQEFERETPDPVIYLMKEWYDYRRQKTCERRDVNSDKGGTMRLGRLSCT